MQRTLWILLCGIMIALLATACPRDQKQDTSTDANGEPETAIDIDVNTDDTSTDASKDTATADTDTDTASSTTPDAAADGTTPAADGTTPPATDTTATPPAAGTTTVVFETTKGNIEIAVHPEWSPQGAAHFLELVNAKFYDGAPWFRVLEGFVAQAGIAADPAMNALWGPKTIPDEPLVQGNKPGFVCFGKSSMPNSRSTHIFINFGDNSAMLDPQGFACFGQVVLGMENANKLFRIPDETLAASGISQQSLGQPGGIDAFKKAFPEADFITKAYVKK
jgi:peptidyl-prolyl cis-trans isomerase A (cyclophilin A)